MKLECLMCGDVFKPTEANLRCHFTGDETAFQSGHPRAVILLRVIET